MWMYWTPSMCCHVSIEKSENIQRRASPQFLLTFVSLFYDRRFVWFPDSTQSDLQGEKVTLSSHTVPVQQGVSSTGQDKELRIHQGQILYGKREKQWPGVYVENCQGPEPIGSSLIWNCSSYLLPVPIRSSEQAKVPSLLSSVFKFAQEPSTANRLTPILSPFIIRKKENKNKPKLLDKALFSSSTNWITQR